MYRVFTFSNYLRIVTFIKVTNIPQNLVLSFNIDLQKSKFISEFQ